MAGTIQGGKAAAKTNKAIYGKDFYKEIGSKGGQIKSPFKGFGTNRELARVVGIKGGRKSRRTKAK